MVEIYIVWTRSVTSVNLDLSRNPATREPGMTPHPVPPTSPLEDTWQKIYSTHTHTNKKNIKTTELNLFDLGKYIEVRNYSLFLVFLHKDYSKIFLKFEVS